MTTLATLALADEPQYFEPVQHNGPTLNGDSFASTCYGCRTKRSAESNPEAQYLALPVPPAPVALPVAPTFLHGVHTVASALDLKNSVPVPVGAPAPKYPGYVVPKIPVGPVFHLDSALLAKM